MTSVRQHKTTVLENENTHSFLIKKRKNSNINIEHTKLVLPRSLFGWLFRGLESNGGSRFTRMEGGVLKSSEGAGDVSRNGGNFWKTPPGKSCNDTPVYMLLFSTSGRGVAPMRR